MAEDVGAAREGDTPEPAEEGQRTSLSGLIARAQLGADYLAVAAVEELTAEPEADAAGNASAAKGLGELAEDKVGVNAGLDLEIAGEGLRFDGAFALKEEEGGLHAMGDLLNESNERGNVALVEGAAGIVAFQFRDEGRGIKDGHGEGIARATEEGAPAGGEVQRFGPGLGGESGAAGFADEAMFQVDRDGRVGALEQELNFAQERHEARMMAGCG